MDYDPAGIATLYDGGTGNMGSLTYGEDTDTNDAARFTICDCRFVPVFIRVHFSGSGSGTADMVVNVDSHQGYHYDHALFTLKSVGIGTPVNFRIPHDERAEWLFDAGDELVLTWTNPDSPNITWGATVGLWGLGDATA